MVKIKFGVEIENQKSTKRVNLELTFGTFCGETGNQGICIQSRCEMGRKREGTFRKIIGSILCPPLCLEQKRGVDLESAGKEEEGGP